MYDLIVIRTFSFLILILSLCVEQIHLSSVLPNGCSFETALHIDYIDAIVCNRFQDFDSISKVENKDYKNLINVVSFYFHFNKRTLIDRSLNYESLSKFILGNQTQISHLVFINIKGFEINYLDSINYRLLDTINQTLIAVIILNFQGNKDL